MHAVHTNLMKLISLADDYRDAFNCIVAIFDRLEKLLPSGQNMQQPEVGSSLAGVGSILCHFELLCHSLNLDTS